MSKVTFKTSEIQKRLSELGGVVSKKAAVPVYGLVQFYAKPGEQVSLTGTDLDATLTIQLKESSADGEVNALLDFKKFAEIMSVYAYADGWFEFEGNQVTIRNGKRAKQIILLRAEDGFRAALDREGAAVELNLVALQEQIANVSFAIAKEKGKYTANVAKLEGRGEKVTMVATDGYRLAMSTKPVPPNTNVGTFDMVIPDTALEVISKLGGETIKIYQSEVGFCFETPLEFYTIQRVSGEFPKYESILPKTSKTIITVPKPSLEMVLKSIKPSADPDKPVIVFRVEEKGTMLVLEAAHVEAGTEGNALRQMAEDVIEESVTVEGPAADFSLDANLLTPFLAQASGALKVAYKEATAPVDFRSGDDYRFIQMPITPATRA